MNAVLAAEDQDFFDHSGVDPFGIVRAAWADVRNQGAAPGRLDDHPAVREERLPHERAHASPARSRRRCSRSSSSRSSPRRRSSSATSTPSTSGGAPTASAPRPGPTSARTSRQLDLPEAAYLAGLIRAPRRPTPPATPRRRPAGAAPCSTPCSRRATSTGRAEADGGRRRCRGSSGPDACSPRAAAAGLRAGAGQRVRHRVLRRATSAGSCSPRGFTDAEIYGGGLRVYTTLDLDLQQAAYDAVTSHARPAGRPAGRARRHRRATATCGR